MAWWRVAVLIVLLALGAGCGGHSSTFTVVLVDGSCSRSSTEQYLSAWTRILAGVQPGDRLVVGTIRGELVAFQPSVDAELPNVPLWRDNALDRDIRRNDFQLAHAEVVARLLEEPCSSRTPILDTLVGVAPFFSGATQLVKRLVLMSDMLEDSSVARFARQVPSDPGSLIEDRTASRALPALADVTVFVVGASAENGDRLRAVQRFWQEFFGATGAQLVPERYGAVLMGWPN